MSRALIALLLLSAAPLPAAAEHAAFVLGMGTVSLPAEEASSPAGTDAPDWRIVPCRPAREEAERAFRELVRAAAGGPLYSVPPLWYDDAAEGFNPAVLLTDGTADNRALPTLPAIRAYGARAWDALAPGDDGIAFLAGPGEMAGLDGWIYARRGGRYAVREAAEALFADPGAGRRVLLARVYGEDGSGPPATLHVADPASHAALRRWAESAHERALRGDEVEPPGRLLPGLSRDLATAAPTRLLRLRDSLRAAPAPSEGRVVCELGTAIESVLQEIELPVELREVTRYETNYVRRAGPLFTIIEEEVVTPTGTVVQIDAGAVAREWAGRLVPRPAAEELARAIRDRADASFTTTNRVSSTDYEIGFDREAAVLRLAYWD